VDWFQGAFTEGRNANVQRYIDILDRYMQQERYGQTADAANAADIISGYNQLQGGAMDLAGQQQQNLIGGYDKMLANVVSQQAGKNAGLNQRMEDRTAHGMGYLEGFGESYKQDIGEQYDRLGQSTQQNLAKRGLGNTTVTASAARGVEADRERASGRLEDSLRRNYVDTYGKFSGDAMAARERGDQAEMAARQNILGNMLAAQERGNTLGLQTYTGTGSQGLGAMTDALNRMRANQSTDFGNTQGFMERRTDDYPDLGQMMDLMLKAGQSAPVGGGMPIMPKPKPQPQGPMGPWPPQQGGGGGDPVDPDNGGGGGGGVPPTENPYGPGNPRPDPKPIGFPPEKEEVDIYGNPVGGPSTPDGPLITDINDPGYNPFDPRHGPQPDPFGPPEGGVPPTTPPVVPPEEVPPEEVPPEEVPVDAEGNPIPPKEVPPEAPPIDPDTIPRGPDGKPLDPDQAAAEEKEQMEDWIDEMEDEDPAGGGLGEEVLSDAQIAVEDSESALQTYYDELGLEMPELPDLPEFDDPHKQAAALKKHAAYIDNLLAMAENNGMRHPFTPPGVPIPQGQQQQQRPLNAQEKWREKYKPVPRFTDPYSPRR